jgi:hypothetical protein
MVNDEYLISASRKPVDCRPPGCSFCRSLKLTPRCAKCLMRRLCLSCSESVKFGHVTFFWNGNRSGYFDEKYEKYVEIATDKGIQVALSV